MVEWCIGCPYAQPTGSSTFCLFVQGTCVKVGKDTILNPIPKMKTELEMRWEHRGRAHLNTERGCTSVTRKRPIEELKADGICTTCEKRKTTDGYAMCEYCRNQRKILRSLLIANHKCVKCRKSKGDDGKTMCFACALKESARADKYYWDKKRALKQA